MQSLIRRSICLPMPLMWALQDGLVPRQVKSASPALSLRQGDALEFRILGESFCRV